MSYLVLARKWRPRTFSELVGQSPSAYKRDQAQATAGMPSCVARQVTKPIRNREAPQESET